MPNINCPVCGAEFFRGPKQIKSTVTQPTCSRTCAEKLNPPKGRAPNYNCVVCGKPHYQRPSAIAKTKHGLTCSKECGRINRSAAMRGEKNHQYGLKGSLNASWSNKDRKLNSDGYWLTYQPDHPRASQDGWFLEHVIILEEHIGRRLKFYGKGNKDNEVCHHKNGDKQNNDISNLELLTHGKHTEHHNKLQTRKRNSKGQFL